MEASTEVGTGTRLCVLDGRCPDTLVAALREQIQQGMDWQQTADRVAETLRSMLPDPAGMLSAEQRQGNPDCYQSHLVHAEPDGSFSVGVMVWLPGQETVIHDHVAWCVTGVLRGREYEEVFAVARTLSTGSATAMRWTKHALNNWLRLAGPSFDTSLALEFLGFRLKDVREGLAAARAKRRPSFDAPTET